MGYEVQNIFRPKNILVTGGAGFIGSHFVRYWQEQHPEARIVNLDLLTYAGSRKNLENLLRPKQHIFVKGNINNQELVEKILQEYVIDTIVHFAAETHVDRSIKDPATFLKTNIMGTHSLLEAARKIWIDQNTWDQNTCRFHHISTDEIYGSLNTNDASFTEENQFAPNSPYAASKAASNHLVRSYFHTYRLPTTTSNCSNNYGTHQHTEKLIPTIMRCCLQNKMIPVYGKGDNIRSWLHVLDHCRAIDLILQNGKVGETYNIGGKDEIKNVDLVQKICMLFDMLKPEVDHQKLIHFVADRPGHDYRYAVNSGKIKKELGWTPRFSLDSVLPDLVRNLGSDVL